VDFVADADTPAARYALTTLMRQRVLDMRNHWLGDARHGPIVSFCANVDSSAMTLNVKAIASVLAVRGARPGAQ
jgi:hypothetical protein